MGATRHPLQPSARQHRSATSHTSRGNAAPTINLLKSVGDCLDSVMGANMIKNTIVWNKFVGKRRSPRAGIASARNGALELDEARSEAPLHVLYIYISKKYSYLKASMAPG